MTLKISREVYASMYGPTTGDKVRLADSDLFIEVEKNYCTYGDEAKFGGGKTLRNAMGQSARATRAQGALDLVITNALIFDYWGIVKADVGIRDGKIVGIGKAGNPDIMADVDPNMVVGPTTEALAGEGKILTAGGIDVHVHYICPQYIEHGLDGGLTTLLGGGTGPNSGTLATTCTPGEWNIMRMIQSMDSAPMNFGFFAKGNASFDAPLVEQIKAGACAMKLHEDWGTTPQAIDACLSVADKMDVQVLIHTDTLNESGYVEDTIASFKGRTIHTFHTEGAGGGHAPDIMRVAGEPNCLPSSTNPTRPYTINTVDEHLDMLMVCHHLDSKIPEDVAFASSRIRAETIAAEDVFHDMGVISMIGSDSQAMGRIGEVWCRTFQTADKMKKQRGALPEEVGDNDNFRCKRFVAKVTINPAIAHGISQYVGSIEVGKIADLVLWRPAFFGIKPDIVMKNGMIVRAQMGDPNASIPTPQPVYSRPMYGAFGVAAVKSGFIFVSQAAYEAGIDEKYSLNKKLLPVFNCRNIGKRHMKLNTATPKITIDPETYEVRVDGNLITCEPAKELCMTQRYFLF